MADLTPDSRETCELLDRIGRGDRRALDKLLDLHRADLRAYVRLRIDRALGARFDASDVVQEVQFAVAERIADFLRRQPMPFHVWLRKTAQDRLVDLRRHHLRQRRTLLAEAAQADRSSQALARSLFDPRSSPSRQISAAELAREIQQALAKLAEADRELLLMRQVERSSFAEIALVLGIEEATARKRFGRALRRLQKVLEERGLLE